MCAVIYVVNSEARFLAMCRDCLGRIGPDWKIRCFEEPDLAIESARADHPDLILADQNLPCMSGSAFFQRVREFTPESVRVLTSDQPDPRAFAYAHQHIAKPVASSELRTKVDKAVRALRNFRNADVRAAVLSLRTLPVLPRVYYDLLSVLGNENRSASDMVDVLKQDTAICAGILRMANSPVFGYGADGQPVTDLLQCVTLLGGERIKGAVLSHQLLKFQSGLSEYFLLASLAQHRWQTADLAFQYAQKMDLFEAVARDAYLAGLLHDLGRLVLSTNFHEVYDRICEQAMTDKKPVSLTEIDRLTISQSDVIGFLVSLWGMRDGIAGALTYQENPWDAPDSEVQAAATAVYLAHYTAHQRCRSELFEQPPLNKAFVDARGLNKVIASVAGE